MWQPWGDRQFLNPWAVRSPCPSILHFVVSPPFLSLSQKVCAWDWGLISDLVLPPPPGLKNSGIIIFLSPNFYTAPFPLGVVPHPLDKRGAKERERIVQKQEREREREKEGRWRSEEWKDMANETLKDSKIACLPKTFTYKLLVINTCIIYIGYLISSIKWCMCW